MQESLQRYLNVILATSDIPTRKQIPQFNKSQEGSERIGLTVIFLEICLNFFHFIHLSIIICSNSSITN